MCNFHYNNDDEDDKNKILILNDCITVSQTFTLTFMVATQCADTYFLY